MKRTESQTRAIEAALLEGKRISPLTALNDFGCFRLSGRIFEIREQHPDWNIKTDMVEQGGKRFAEYRLQR